MIVRTDRMAGFHGIQIQVKDNREQGNTEHKTPNPKTTEDITIIFKKTGVSTHIILTLIWVLFLSMALTVLLMATLWQRDIIHGFADMEKIKLQHLIEDNRTAPENILKNKSTAAIGGVFISSSGKVTQIGVVNGHTPALHSRAEQVLSENNSFYILDGFFWNIIIPARAYLSISIPVPGQESNRGAIAMLYPLDHVYRQMEKSFRIIFPCLLVNMLVLLAIALFRFRRFLFLPLTKLIRLADTYHEEEIAPFLTLTRNNELGQLSSSLQKMLHRIENDRKKLRQSISSLESANQELLTTREEMIRTEKLAAAGRLAAGLAHEIGNPLGVVLGYIGLLRQADITSTERVDFTDRAEKEIQRINRLIGQLLDLSRINDNRCLKQVSIHTILRNLMDMMTTCQPVTTEVHNIMEFTAGYDIVKGDPDQLQQVFLNCLLNAADALTPITDKKTIRIKTIIIADRNENRKDNQDNRKEKIRITISDSGEGIPPEHLARIFDPFFTTKEPGKGTGLGLSVAFSIIEQHGGVMKVKSSTGQGTTVIVELPLDQMPDARG